MNSKVNYLKEFAYDSKLKELNVFSKQYFNSVLYSMYKEVPENNLLCFTFGDFNKLNKINKEYSYEAGDEALKVSLKLIRDTLPDDTIIARIAGDEFCFLNPNKSKREMDKAFNKADAVLRENKDINYGLTITTGSIDSTIFSSFNDMYAHTELDVTRKKKSNHNEEKSLSKAIYNGLSNYFSYYRIDASSLPKEYYSVLKNSIIDLVIHNLEQQNEELAPYLEDLRRPSNIDFESRHLEMTSKSAARNS